MNYLVRLYIKSRLRNCVSKIISLYYLVERYYSDTNVFRFRTYDKTSRFLRGFLSTFGLVFSIFLIILITLLFAFFTCNILYSFKLDGCVDWDNVRRFGYFDMPGFSAIFSSIIALFALSSPAIAYYWSMQQNERTKINLSYEFLREWREGNVPKAMYNINAYFKKGKEDELKKSLYATVKDASLNLKSDEFAELTELARSIRDLLNYFESIATACHRGHVDVSVIKRYFEKVIIKYYKLLIIYIIDARLADGLTQQEAHNDKVGYYSDFTGLAKRWMRLKGLTEPN